MKNTETKAYVKISEQLSKLTATLNALKDIKDVPVLSETAKTHLADLYTVSKYNRTEDIKSKYMEKGLHMEEDAITAASLFINKFFKKNDERKSNGFITGEADFIDEEFVNDTKVNWSLFQFNRLAAKPMPIKYKWQLKGYCWLWGTNRGRLIYVLLNTPEYLLQHEIKNLKYDFAGTDEELAEAIAEVRHNHIYNDIPREERIRIYIVEAPDEAEEKLIQQYVLEGRRFMNSLNIIKPVEDDGDNSDQE